MINELQLKRRTDLYALIRDRILEINKSFSDLYTAVENNDILKYQRTGNELERATCASVSHASFMRYYIKKELNKFNAIDLQKLNGIYNRNFVPIIINIAKKAELRA